VTESDDDSVAELIEINLLYAQMELSLGCADEAATLRALDHIMEALRHLRDETRGALKGALLDGASPARALPKGADQPERVEPAGDFS
jgi:hypothetical protein